MLKFIFFYSPAPRRGRGVYCFTSVRPYVLPSFRPSVRPRYFHRIFRSNCRWQKSDIWSQASYRYTILWVAFLDPSDSYFLFADLVGFYPHWIRVITKLPNSEQSYKGKVKTHNYINRQNQWTTENCENRNDPDLVQVFLKKWWVESDFKAPNLPLSLRFKGSGCHCNSI